MIERPIAVKSFIALAGTLVLVLSACSSPESRAKPTTETTPSTSSTATLPETTTTASAGPPVLVVAITEAGGCFMMGPNCATYLVYSDGSAELVRTGGNREAEATATIDLNAVAELQDLLASSDLVAIHASLPEGECQGCFDGIDTTFRYETSNGTVSFASTEVELVLSEPLLAATWAIRDAAGEALELPILQRP